MALLTQLQREKFNEYGSVNIDMTQERKTIFDYIRLTPEVRQEFNDIIKFAFSDAANKLGWHESKMSSNQHFEFTDDRLRVVTKFHGHRMDDSGRRSETILKVSSSAIAIYPQECGKTSPVYLKLQSILCDFCINDLKFPKDHYRDLDFNTYFHKEKSVKTDLLEILEKSFCVNISTFALPGMPHSLRLSDVEGFVEYVNKGRTVVMKIGKGLRKFFKIHGMSLTDEEIKNSSNRLNASSKDFELRVVEGSDIDKYYHYKSYDDTFNTNSLQNSCMRGDDAQQKEFFQVYKEHAKMIILVHPDTDLIIARAILWNDAEYLDEDDSEEGLTTGDTVNLMDRIYGDESSYQVFKDWALANGYYRKRYQSYTSESLWRSPVTKQEVDLKFRLRIELNSYDYVPYMDTFAWGDDDFVVNSEGYGYYTARDTEGTLDGGDNQHEYWNEDEDEY